MALLIHFAKLLVIALLLVAVPSLIVTALVKPSIQAIGNRSESEVAR